MSNKPACLSCGSIDSSLWAIAHDVEYMTHSGEFQYLKCANCESLFIDPVPKDRLQQIYPNNYYSYSEPSSSILQSVKDKLDQRQFSSLLAGIKKENIAALDIGGGAGQQLDVLRSLDSRVTYTQVVDLNSEAQSVAQAKGHEYFCGPIESYESSKKFDVILLLNIIEHVACPGEILKKVSLLLSDEGVVMLKTPNIDSLDARIFRHRNWTGYHCPRHWVLFNAQGLSTLCTQSGLSVAKLKHTQGAPFWAGSLVHFFSPKTATAEGRYSRIVDHPLYKLFSGIFAAFDLARAKISKPSQLVIVLQKNK